MAARGSPATKKPKCDPADLTRLPDAELAAQIEALDTEQCAADAAFKTQIQAIDAKRAPLKDELRRRQYAKEEAEHQKEEAELQRKFDAGEISCMDVHFTSTFFGASGKLQSIDNPGNSEVFYTSSNTSTRTRAFLPSRRQLRRQPVLAACNTLASQKAWPGFAVAYSLCTPALPVLSRTHISHASLRWLPARAA